MRRIVCDASPLITLCKAGLVDILRDRFKRVLCPRAVVAEIASGPEEDMARGMLLTLTWLEFVSLDPPLSPLAVWQLGQSEAEVIEYARLNPGAIALLDDRISRRAAKAAGVPVLGTLGLIAGLTTHAPRHSPDAAVAKLAKAGFYIEESTARAMNLQPKRK